MKKIIDYIRISRNKQDLNNQKLEILEYARQKDIKIDDFIEIEASSKKTVLQRRIEEILKDLKNIDSYVELRNKFMQENPNATQNECIQFILSKSPVLLSLEDIEKRIKIIKYFVNKKAEEMQQSYEVKPALLDPSISKETVASDNVSGLRFGNNDNQYFGISNVLANAMYRLIDLLEAQLTSTSSQSQTSDKYLPLLTPQQFLPKPHSILFVFKTILLACFFCVNVCLGMDGEYRDDDDDSGRQIPEIYLTNEDERTGGSNYPRAAQREGPAFQLLDIHAFYELLFKEHEPMLGQDAFGRIQRNYEMGEGKTLTQVVEENTDVSERDLFRRVVRGLKDFEERKMETSHRVKVMDLETIRKLHVLCGDKSDDNRNLCKSCAQLFPVQTMIGHVFACERLVMFFSQDELEQFQQKIKALRTCGHLKELREAMYTISKNERAFLWLWVNNEEGKKDDLEEYTAGRTVQFPFADHPSINPHVVGLGSAPIADFSLEPFAEQFRGWLIGFFVKAGRNTQSDDYIYEVKRSIREKIGEIFEFHSAIESLLNILGLYGDVPELRALVNQLVHFDQQTKELTEHKKKYEEVERNPVDFFGELLILYQYLYSIRDELFEIYSAIGHLDLLVSIVDLLEGSASESHLLKYSLVTFSNSADSVFENYWHPLIAARQQGRMTANTIRVAANNPHVIVISGDNGNGKTTALRSLGICMLLSRTVGIAPASLCTHSLQLVLTSIDIRDTLGLMSRFQAQEKRKNEIEEAVKNSEYNLLILMDEPLSGTTPTKTAATLKRHMAVLRQHAGRCIVIMTTHSDDIIELVEQNPALYSPYYAHRNYTVTQHKKRQVSGQSRIGLAGLWDRGQQILGRQL